MRATVVLAGLAAVFAAAWIVGLAVERSAIQNYERHMAFGDAALDAEDAEGARYYLYEADKDLTRANSWGPLKLAFWPALACGIAAVFHWHRTRLAAPEPESTTP